MADGVRAIDDRLRAQLFDLLAHDPVPEVRAEAARALGAAAETGVDVVERLVAALEDENDRVRRTATLALARVSHPLAVDALLSSLESDPELWQETSAALASAAGSDAVKRLVPLLSAPASQTRCGALRALAALAARPADAELEPAFVYTDAEGHQHPLF